MIEVFKPLAVDSANRNTAFLCSGVRPDALAGTAAARDQVPCDEGAARRISTDAATKAQLEAIRVQCAHLMSSIREASGFSNVLRAVEKIEAHAVNPVLAALRSASA